MKQGGAISFYDYKKPITNANLLKLALQYTQAFGACSIFPLEMSVANKGLFIRRHSQYFIGIERIPSFAEELQIARDIKILEYTGGKLHIRQYRLKIPWNSFAMQSKRIKRKLQCRCF